MKNREETRGKRGYGKQGGGWLETEGARETGREGPGGGRAVKGGVPAQWQGWHELKIVGLGQHVASGAKCQPPARHSADATTTPGTSGTNTTPHTRAPRERDTHTHASYGHG